MRPNQTDQRWARAPFRKVAIIAFGAAVFLGVASVVKPPPRSAEAGAGSPLRAPETSRRANNTAITRSNIPAHAKGWRLIGTLEGREHRVNCYASPEGPRYSVHTLDGALLQADLPADEVYRLFPEIDLQNMTLEPGEGGALMLMDRD